MAEKNKALGTFVREQLGGRPLTKVANRAKSFYHNQSGQTNIGLTIITSIVGTLFILLLFLIGLPLAQNGANGVTLNNLLDELKSYGYVVYGAPSGDWTTLGELWTKDILPQSDDTFTIGTSSVRYKTGYFSGNVTASNLVASGNVTGSSGTFTDIKAPTGRGETIFIAASDASALEKAQADYVCTKVSTLSATIANGTGTVSEPGAWTSNTSKTVTVAGTFTVTLAAGQTAIATSGTATIVGSPVALVAGANTIDTGVTAGTIYISGMGDEYYINTALNTLSDYGGMVLLSTGQFVVRSPINVPKRTNLQGQGLETSRIYLANYSNCDIVSINQSVLGQAYVSSVKDLRLYSTVANQIAGNGVHISYTAPATVNMDCTLERLFITVKEDGIKVDNGWGTKIYDCLPEYCGGDGIQFSGTQCYIANCFSAYNSGSGYNFTDGSLLHVDKCVAYRSGRHGYSINGLTSSLFNSCTARDNGELAANTYHGFYLNGPNTSVFSNLESRDTASNIKYGIYSYYADNNIIEGCKSLGGTYGLAISGSAANTSVIRNNDFTSNTTGSVYYPGGYSAALIRGNRGYCAPGEIRSVSGSLTAGNANAIGFAWHNIEAQDIYIAKVVVAVTTAGGTAGSHLDVGIADDATGTNRGTEFFNDLLLENISINDSLVAASAGTQTVWVLCQDSASATDGWVVGQILDANAASLVGSYYIEYVGK